MAQEVQTTYSATHPEAVAGLLGSGRFNIISRLVETAAGIGFGLPAGQGSGENGVVLAGALAGFLGVTVRDVSRQPADADKYPQYAVAGIVSEGEIWVVVGEAVAVNDPVWYNSTTGAWFKATNTGLVGPIVGARYRDAVALGGFARIVLGIRK